MKRSISIITLLLTISFYVTPSSAANPVVRIGTWGGQWRETIHELVGKWVESQGVRVEYVLGNPADNLAKIIAAPPGNPPIDVMDLLTDVTSIMLKGGYLEKVDRGAIPNVKAIPSEYTHELMTTYAFQQDGILFRADKFKELGIPVPTKYGDLTNPKLANRVALPDAGVSSFWSMLIGLNGEMGGDETTLDRAIARTADVKALYYYTSTTEVAQKLKMGEVWAALTHVGWAIRLRDQGLDLAFVHPQFGQQKGIFNTNSLGIVKGTKNRKAAELVINRYLDPTVQSELLKRVGVMPILEAARVHAAEDPKFRDTVLWSNQQLKQGHFTNWDKVDSRKVRDAWTRAPK